MIIRTKASCWIGGLVLLGLVSCQTKTEPEKESSSSSISESPRILGDSKPETKTSKPASKLPIGIVEPPLEERPLFLYWVVIERLEDLAQAQALFERLEAHPLLPVGYPAIAPLASNTTELGFGVLGGKYARKIYAQQLVQQLKSAGFKHTGIEERPYQHDRFRPSVFEGEEKRLARVFAGMTGMKVPLLSEPSPNASGTGVLLDDGALVSVVGQVIAETELWTQIQLGPQHGYIPGARLLSDYNLFPSPSGRWGVLGISLGCLVERCLWDYWIVDAGFKSRRLLATKAERLSHAFSISLDLLAYENSRGEMKIVTLGGFSETLLGIGMSPSWTPEGKQLYFRQPGKPPFRDQVMQSEPPTWESRVVLDFRGEPIYPKGLSVVPPSVDVQDNGQQLFTMFYRLSKEKDLTALHRWKVWFTPEGKILKQQGEQLTE